MPKSKVKRDSPSYLQALGVSEASLFSRSVHPDTRLSEQQEKELIEGAITEFQRNGKIPRNVSTDRLNVFVMAFDDTLRELGLVGL